MVNLLKDEFLFGISEEQNKDHIGRSGSGIRFCTNEKTIEIELCLEQILRVRQHIGSSLTNGIWYAIWKVCCGGGHATKLTYMNAVVVKEIRSRLELYLNPKKESVIVEIYFPILNHVNILTVNADYVDKVVMDEPVLLFLGGELTYGVGTTSANSIFANIVTRKLGVNGFNLSIYDSDFLRVDIARQSAQYRPDYIITECGCKKMSVEYIEENLEEYLMTLAGYNRDTHIILLMEDELYNCKSKIQRKELIHSIVETCRMRAPLQIQCMELNTVLNDEDRYTYSSNFYNDFANIMIAKSLLALVKTWM